MVNVLNVISPTTTASSKKGVFLSISYAKLGTNLAIAKAATLDTNLQGFIALPVILLNSRILNQLKYKGILIVEGIRENIVWNVHIGITSMMKEFAFWYILTAGLGMIKENVHPVMQDFN